jgi:serine O-acetyltransferase
MNTSFKAHLLQQHAERKNLPSPQLIEQFIDSILGILFPAYSNKPIQFQEQLEEEIARVRSSLGILLLHVESELNTPIEQTTEMFFSELEALYQLLLLDAEAIEQGDPAAKSMDEVMRTYPGFYAIAIYRIAHQLYAQGVPYIARMFTELAHGKTGIDIHPGAQIGSWFFIDHGTGVVIGETTVIGNHVKLYQGVTLGALSVKKEMAETKRHPSIEDHVVVYAGATILGGRTSIGHHSVIGGNVWLTKSVDPYSTVYHQPELIIQKGNQHG